MLVSEGNGIDLVITFEELDGFFGIFDVKAGLEFGYFFLVIIVEDRVVDIFIKFKVMEGFEVVVHGLVDFREFEEGIGRIPGIFEVGR